MMEKVYEIYIKTTPEKLWEAITSSEVRSKIQFGIKVDTDWRTGSHMSVKNPKTGDLLGEGVNVELDRPHKLVQTMVALWSDDVKAEGETRVTWEISQVGDSCCLLVTHDRLRDNANDQLYGGWPMILSGLKTWLETGESLTTPGSLMYS